LDLIAWILLLSPSVTALVIGWRNQFGLRHRRTTGGNECWRHVQSHCLNAAGNVHSKSRFWMHSFFVADAECLARISRWTGRKKTF